MKIIISEKLLIEKFGTQKRYGYFATSQKLELGKKITPNHHPHYHEQSHEIKLEEVRENHYPDKISRQRCFYLSPYIENKFSNRGLSYKCEIIGKTHYGDSDYIEKIYEFGNEEDIHDYWKGKLGKKKSIEILAEAIIPIEIVNQDKIKAGNQVKLINNDLIFHFYYTPKNNDYFLPNTKKPHRSNFIKFMSKLKNGTIIDVLSTDYHKSNLYGMGLKVKGEDDENEMGIRVDYEKDLSSYFQIIK